MQEKSTFGEIWESLIRFHTGAELLQGCENPLQEDTGATGREKNWLTVNNWVDLGKTKPKPQSSDAPQSHCTTPANPCAAVWAQVQEVEGSMDKLSELSFLHF